MTQDGRPSLLEQVETALDVDADTLDAKFISELPIKVHDVTSNQRFVHEALVADVNKEIVEQTVREMMGKPWQEVYAVCVSAALGLRLDLSMGISKGKGLTGSADRTDGQDSPAAHLG